MQLSEALAKLCDALNKASVKYVLVGGCAVILHGYYRTTHDIDLLVDAREENIRRLKEALFEVFKTREAFDINDRDVLQYAVVRFAPESENLAVDLLKAIGDIDFQKAFRDIENIEVGGVQVPVAGLSTLIETKKGLRPKDQEDLLFLRGKKEYLDKTLRNKQG
jgi:predicted nucleotidyltransferase